MFALCEPEHLLILFSMSNALEKLKLNNTLYKLLLLLLLLSELLFIRNETIQETYHKIKYMKESS